MYFKSRDCLHKSDYFVKAADSCIVEEECNIKRNDWALDVQKLDGTKASVHVSKVSGDVCACSQELNGIAVIIKDSNVHTDTATLHCFLLEHTHC